LGEALGSLVENPKDVEAHMLARRVRSTKHASAVIAAGAMVSWDDTAKEVNVPGTGLYPVGVATEATNDGITTVRVRLGGVATAAT